jgi:hypothetical protein
MIIVNKILKYGGTGRTGATGHRVWYRQLERIPLQLLLKYGLFIVYFFTQVSSELDQRGRSVDEP